MSNSESTIEMERCHPPQFVRPTAQGLQDASDAFEHHIQEHTRDISFRDSLFETWKKQRIAAGKLIKIEDGYSDTIEPRLEGIRDYLETLKGHFDEVKFPQLSIADLTEHNPRITERNPLVPKESTFVRDTVLVGRDDIPFFVWFRDGPNGVTRGASSNRGHCI
ncbi:hypothetical protein IFR04_015983 [Cadophora malorum]|uniref:Uncharacterized protein n=1 Tax=Cadophora malorum TaxID=108018 RepID=A0A8H7T0P5_9HELO|nr:hypothetical protein IFR04_015983 [Cadophora malorum]